ncbi:hypothetical protein AZ965_004557 [Salmonella enterica subsp. enterica serovar 4,[5],12:i:-]|uniref:Neuromedin U C-terminal domain-containing protein n=7 Tax=Salmonella enterica TaxID=28901 RepID=A0A625WNH9_SALEN|nr:hypothetical protein DLJ72_21975 [Salmonella enterica subsp. enterica serovar Typhimurium]EAA0576430.1 hypothetical protein [Salmonella enterica]EAA0709645.1 hypothetical protein [Salmonella enterica subsp. enterica]EAA7742616.1 hypothetical protein [Salmonella enterica subsp. enterica serovar 4,[5],12:i:-]EAB8146729.1 hypothetical protein [Salmonella enterica subsp. enterica serovar Colindale]EAB9435071.1 hypothetical protein [Salmonella enterica subsp. enterica serovar Typhimurium str. UK
MRAAACNSGGFFLFRPDILLTII